MNAELDKKLCEKYPKIFRDRRAPMNRTAMCWGFEHGDGWYNIIDALCHAMTHTYTTCVEIDEERGKRWGVEPTIWPNEPKPKYLFHVEAPQAVADQIKEKFGTLRFYYHLEFDPHFKELAYGDNPIPEARQIADSYNSYFDGMVHLAEKLSARTCEETGKEGELHVSGGTRGGWLRTLNREYAKTNEFCVSRDYVPYADLPKDEDRP